MRPHPLPSALRLGCLLLGAPAFLAAQDHLGYQDTPIIPGTQWHVHDGERPQPRIVTPAATFSLLAPPPSDAIVLFDGHDLSQWVSADDGSPAQWKVSDGVVEETPIPGKPKIGSISTKQRFPDFQLHLEYAEPTVITGKGQDRGNSGVMINGMYEVQILDSYHNPTYPDGQAGALYGQTPPLVNACKPPGEWQSYDIIFESPRWDSAGMLVKKATVTVIQNGVVLQNHREFFGHTDGIGGIPHKALGAYGAPHSPEVVIELQAHKNRVRFRNIWIRKLGDYDQTGN
jgi:3-keto-disaccharide hydrolase